MSWKNNKTAVSVNFAYRTPPKPINRPMVEFRRIRHLLQVWHRTLVQPDLFEFEITRCPPWANSDRSHRSKLGLYSITSLARNSAAIGVLTIAVSHR
jgi:hypothetical protein